MVSNSANGSSEAFAAGGAAAAGLLPVPNMSSRSNVEAAGAAAGGAAGLAAAGAEPVAGSMVIVKLEGGDQATALAGCIHMHMLQNMWTWLHAPGHGCPCGCWRQVMH